MSSCILIYVCFATLFCVSSFVLAKPGFLAWVCGKALTSMLSCQQVEGIGGRCNGLLPPNFPSFWFAVASHGNCSGLQVLT